MAIISQSFAARRTVVAVAFKVALVAVLSIALWFSTWVLDRASMKLALFAYGWTYGSYVNAIPVVLVFLLLLALLNRVVLAFVITLVLTTALYAANYLKLKYLDIPVSFSDAYLLGNLHLSTLKLLSDYVNTWYLLVLAVLAAAFVAASVWLERRYFGRRSISRAVVALIAAFCLISAGAGVEWVGSVYSGSALRVKPFSPLLTQLHAGLISSILHTDVEHRRTMNAPIDVNAAKAFIAMNGGKDAVQPLVAGRSEHPDIVVVQSESFFDPGILKDIPNTDETLPNLHRALAAGVGGTMKAPTFGGGTLRTEFEVLTSVPLATYAHVEFPYLQIVQPVIPSFVRVLRKHGYQTVAIHANDPTFWNRNVAFKEIGFQRFLSKTSFPHAKQDGWFTSDAATTDKIITTLNEATSPLLVFAVSIEAHGPYLNDPVDDPARRDAIPAPAGMDDKALLEYRNYMYHIENADRQMGRLWDFLVHRGRPFILVFYGDHLPALTYAFGQVDFDNGQTGPRQDVPWFIVGSGIEHGTRHIKSWMMGSDILRAAGVSLPTYYRFVAKAQAALEANPDRQRQDTIENGIHALARLHMRGELETYLAHGESEGEAHVTTASNR